MNFQKMAHEANQDKVWKKGELSEYEKVFQNLSGKEGINQNWLNMEADKAGIDRDYIYGLDDGEEPKKYSEENQTISWSDIFFKITGIKIEDNSLIGKEIEVKFDGRNFKAKIIE